MLEGYVQGFVNLLLGYLGRYIKDIQKDQLKISLWNGEVLLENVELNPEAFEYLQLPIALKQGRVGKLSIKIPWKKLHRDPVTIRIEDVFICASQRNDQEWSSDVVEKREFAGKKAKLASAELAKLSRRVFDNPGGNSYMSYITAKILDSVQVSIKNFHILYSDAQPESGQVVLGLRFSSLTVTKQNSVGPSVGRVRGGQVNILVEVEGLEIYCDMYEGNMDFPSVNEKIGFDNWCQSRLQSNRFGYLLKPVHVSVTLLVNRSGELYDDLPQYSISAELTDVVVTLNEFQLQQILILLDYLQTSQLRERYGRYRPCSTSLSRKPPGWQKLWWHYAQNSVLSDVRKKLWKTSWRFLEQRMRIRRRYINFYKIKLDLLLREQSIDKSIRLGLEELEKKSDIDDILSYRSAAEGEMQEACSELTVNMGATGATRSEKEQSAPEKEPSDDPTLNKSRGWLNWLSRGMLGAGGTEDSSQFSGVVSDEVVKDIHKATKFYPLSSSPRNTSATGKICTCSIRLNVRKFSATLQHISGSSSQVITELDILGVIVECKSWKDSTAMILSVISGRLVYPHNGKEILTMKRVCSQSDTLETKPSYGARLELSKDHDVALSLKATLQPLEAAYDGGFILAVSNFFSGSRYFKLQHERILSSLNGLESETRLAAKAEYLLSSRNKVKWDLDIKDLTLSFPGRLVESESYNLVLVLESLSITSSSTDALSQIPRLQSDVDHVVNSLQSSVEALDAFQVKDLYDHFDIKICNLEMKLMKIHPFQELPLVEKSSLLIKFASCIIPEESILKQLEVEATLPMFNVHFSPSIFKGVMSVIEYLDIQDHGTRNPPPSPAPIFHFTIKTDLAFLRLHVNLENKGENSTVLVLSIQQLDLWYSRAIFEEWSVRAKTLEITACSSKDAADSHILCSSGNLLKSSSHGHGMDAHTSDETNIIDYRTTPEAAISLNCKVSQSKSFIFHKYTVYWRSAELHCYPYIFGLLTNFLDKIASYKISSSYTNPSSLATDTIAPTEIPQFDFERFGFSNFTESRSCGCIPLDKFPFVTINNSGSLHSLESSLCYSTSDWRKLFILKNRKDGAQIGLNCECNSCTFQLKRDCPLNGLASSRDLGQTNHFTVDMHVFNTNVHFHDSSSVFGTIILPVSRYFLNISDDLLDLVASAEDLMLVSSLFTNYSGGFLWKQSSTDVSQVLNLRVRKRGLEPSGSQLEVSIGIQHTYCILPPEYLAIIIGYFSLSDWTSKSGLQSLPQATELTKAHSEFAISYKIEILDSSIVLPVEGDDRRQLKVDIQQLYISFIPECALSNVVQHIPQECVIPLNQVPGRADCLNIFGRDLSVSLLLSESDISTFKKNAVCRSITLAASIIADTWIRFPCDHNPLTELACVMSRVDGCEIVVDDSDALDGFKAFLDVVDQLSLVDEESKLFVSDVPQFLHTKMRLKQELSVAPLEPSTSFIKFRIFVNLLTSKLHRLRKAPGTLLSEPVLQADMKFVCSGELKNNFPMSLDVQFFKIGLYSLLSSVMLARCINADGDPSALRVRFTEQAENEYDLCFSLPSLDIWLHFFDWIEVIELLKSYSQKLEDSSEDRFFSKGSKLDMDESIGVVRTICDNTDRVLNVLQTEVSENSSEVMSFAARSENIGVKIHIPLCTSHTEFPGFMATDVHEISEEEHTNCFKGNYCKYVSVTACSRSGELSILGRDVKLSYKIEKLNGILAISGVDTVRSCSLFGAAQLLVETSIQMDQNKIMSIDVGILSDKVEMHASHQVLSFWHGITFDAPETPSSQNSEGNMSIKVQIRDVSLLISDGKWGCSGMLLEVLMRNFLLQANLAEKNMESLVSCDLEVNYNNMHKVLWEPFIEPWNFDIKLSRKFDANSLLNNAGLTEVIVASSNQLNLNLTESLFECIFRIIEMLNILELMETDAIPDNKGLSVYCTNSTRTERYSPYVLQNLTSLPLGYQVFQGHDSDVLNISAPVAQNFVQPGCSVPIYIDNSDTLLIPDRRRSQFGCSSSESGDAIHHYMKVQLDGTSFASPPHSMDRIGLSYFEVDFSKTSNSSDNVEKASKSGYGSSFVVPVVYEVSLQQQSKLIRVYSTVIILNSTSMPLELRFDIPFGISPKILDPIFPGQEFPLPLHLAKSGRLRWRPLGDSYLWSEAHSISKVLSQDSGIGFRRSFACYPCHPSHEPFRCCISVQSTSLPASFHINDLSAGNFGQQLHNLDQSREQFIHQVTLSTPFVVSNCLPDPISLSIESGGITQTASLPEGETPFHHIDPSHDLVLEFKLNGCRTSSLKFSRSETFSTEAKFSGGKFSQIETISFDSHVGGGSVYVSCEKTMDATCGAREVLIFVPFLLYNCTGTPLIVSDCTNETKGIYSVIPSCYNLIEQHFVQSRKVGLGILTSEKDLLDKAVMEDIPCSPSSSECSNTASSTERFIDKHATQSTRQVPFAAYPKDSAIVRKRSLSSKSLREVCFQGNDESGKVKACIYSPCPISRVSDTMIRVKRDLPGWVNSSSPYPLWSAPFPLVPPSGSTNVVVPQPSPGESSLLSVTCSILGGALAGRTQAITFQPRYIICNSCSHNLCYKQKGTNLVSHLAVGQHSQLQWTDTTRELLVSIRLNEPGWQWSGSFLPDHLGDTQLKIWNYVNKAFNMVRVEVQNANMSSGDEKIVGSVHGHVGTNFILLSDDDMGYMPYRIDNFSNERLRVYQQKCETFDTIVHPYTSCPYAWDEPCYPHRLTIEVPGDRVLGSYAFEITKQPIAVHLRSTSEKPERTLLLSICAEGATKVFSVVDSGYHAIKDIKETFDSRFHEKGKKKLQTDNIIRYTETFLLVLPSIGISLVNSHPQELVYACASNVVLELSQSVDQQKLSFQISSLQIDNPLQNSSYPVILSFNHDHEVIPPDWGMKNNKAILLSEIVQQVRGNSCDAVVYVDLAKWRKKDVSLVSFEYINIRIGEFGLELELQTLLSLLEFVKAVLPNSQARLLPLSDPTLRPLIYDTGSKDISSEDTPHARNIPVFNKNQRSIVALPIVVPIGAPWQHIHLLARRRRKIYVETFDLAPIQFTLSFCSAPWMLRNGILTSGESLIHRGLMALADVEGARIHLKQLTIAHQITSWESFQEILVGHYTRQILHEIYKVFGSAGVIGNPMGFARNVAFGIKDFLSAPSRSISKSPAGIIQGMAHGTTSLFSSTIYALSDAATQFSKAAHKGIVAFTFNDHDVARMEKQQLGEGSRSKGVIGEVFEGLTGLLQSPIRGAEKHGLPGVISGVAMGITGLVARPTASILEVTGKTAQSIRNRSRIHNIRSQRHRLRLPRPLSREQPLRPYSWEEAVGTAVLMEVGDSLKFKGEKLVKCKALKQEGAFVVITGRLVLVLSSLSLVDFRKQGFLGVPIDLVWNIEREIGLESVIHTDCSGGVVRIIGSNSDGVWNWRQDQQKKSSPTKKRWNNPSAQPLLQTNLEFPSEEEAEDLLSVLLSTIETGKSRSWHSRFVLSRSNIT